MRTKPDVCPENGSTTGKWSSIPTTGITRSQSLLWSLQTDRQTDRVRERERSSCATLKSKDAPKARSKRCERDLDESQERAVVRSRLRCVLEPHFDDLFASQASDSTRVSRSRCSQQAALYCQSVTHTETHQESAGKVLCAQLLEREWEDADVPK